MSAKEVLQRIKADDIKYVDFRFTDPRGKWQHVTFDQTLEGHFALSGSERALVLGESLAAKLQRISRPPYRSRHE